MRQLGQCNEKFGIGGFAKVLDADVSRVFVEHVSGTDAFLWNLAARDGEFPDFGTAISHHAHFHLGVFWTLQPMHGFLIGHHLSHKRFAVY